jgi:hypothetical protein
MRRAQTCEVCGLTAEHVGGSIVPLCDLVHGPECEARFALNERRGPRYATAGARNVDANGSEVIP